MDDRRAIFIVVDGLRADAIGAYGGCEETPFLDQLAADSTLYDFTFCLDPDLRSFYRCARYGIHPWYYYAGIVGPELVRRGGGAELASLRHALFTDLPAPAEPNTAAGDWTAVETLSATGSAAGSHDVEGRVGAFFDAARAWIDGMQRPKEAAHVIWLHTSVLAECAVDSSQGTSEMYHTRVQLLDEAIGNLFGQVSAERLAGGMLFGVIGARGFALGERGHVGLDPPLLHEELLHVPLIVHFGDRPGEPARISQLVSPAILPKLLREWFTRSAEEAADAASPGGPPGEEAEGYADTTAKCLFFVNSRGDHAIRTPGWYFLRSGEADIEGVGSEPTAPGGSLYLKPDDRWESNEVLSRRTEIAGMLAEHLTRAAKQVAAGQPLDAGPLQDELLRGE